MKTRLDSRFLAQSASVLLLLPVLAIASISADKELEYPEYRPSERDITLSRSEYANHLYGFWLGQCIANWTGLRTELHREEAPFYTDANWGGKSDKGRKINFVLKGENSVWMADDDTDIEYIYQHALDKTNTSVLSPEAISEAWVRHIRVLEDGEPYKLWVSNKTAWSLMSEKGILPPDTSDPASNPNWDMIDAQLTTEIFGLFAPHRPDVALDIAHLPIRTTAYQEAQWISEFYVIMHSLALSAGANQGMHERTVWLAEQARKRLPAGSYSAAMYDFVKADYEANPDKDDWERTRDAVYQRYQLEPGDGYQYKKQSMQASTLQLE
ncbi:MAG: ADP-ribosylglycohydrolase family protein [Verrucomicrobiota bacterium]